MPFPIIPAFGALIATVLGRRLYKAEKAAWDAEAQGALGGRGLRALPAPTGYGYSDNAHERAEERNYPVPVEVVPREPTTSGMGRRLSRHERETLPDRAFIFPKSRTYPIAIRQGGTGRPVPSRAHAIAARARARQAFNAGRMSKRGLAKVWFVTGKLFDLPMDTLGAVPPPAGKEPWYSAGTRAGWPSAGSNCTSQGGGFGDERYDDEYDAEDRNLSRPSRRSPSRRSPSSPLTRGPRSPSSPRSYDEPKPRYAPPKPRYVPYDEMPRAPGSRPRPTTQRVGPIQDPTRCKNTEFPRGHCQDSASWRSGSCTTTGDGPGGASSFPRSYFGDAPMSSFGKRPNKFVLPGGRELFFNKIKVTGRDEDVLKFSVAVKAGGFPDAIAKRGVEQAKKVANKEFYVKQVLSSVVLMVPSPIGPVPYIQNGWAACMVTVKAES